MAPPNRIATDLVRVDGRTLEYVTAPLLADGMNTAFESLSGIGANSFTAVEPLAGFSSNGASSGIFRSVSDFMTGGNRHHNAEADYLVREIVRRVEAVRQESVDPSEVRDWVHQELIHFKDNGGDQYNGNVSRSDWAEVIDHGIHRFAGRSRVSTRTVENSEGMNWRVEELIETEMMKPGNEALWSDPNLETIRATLRTRLRAEFSGILMNEWGSERLEDISDFLKSGIVADFEGRAESIVAEGITSSAVCISADPVPAAPAPAVVPSVWSEVMTNTISSTAIRSALNGVDPRLAEYFESRISTLLSPATTVSDLLTRVGEVDPAILDQALAAATADGRPISQAIDRVIFELVARAAESRGVWSASDPMARPGLAGRFETGLRDSRGEGPRVESVKDRARRENEERRRESERRARP